MGIQRVVACHGSFASASCIRCKAQVDVKEIEADIFAKIVPKCKSCKHKKKGVPNVIKVSSTPCVVLMLFFGDHPVLSCLR